VEFCRKMSLFDIILEGDALQVVNAVNSGGHNRSHMGHIIDGIKAGLGTLRSWCISASHVGF
jgi:hypothetical protein